MDLNLDICAYCDCPTWCYQTVAGPMCRGCHVIAYIGGILYQPLGLVLLPWQERWLREVYGTVSVETGERTYWKAYAELPGKNGKSFLVGALPIYHLDAEGVEGAQAFGMASAKEQAAIVYRAAARLVRDNPDPDFRSRFKVLASTHRILHRKTNGLYRVLSADGRLNDGEEPSLAIYDELHRWSTAKARDLYHVMNKGTVSRPGSLSVEITTAGSISESPICYREHERAKRILSGQEQPGRLHVTIYCADEVKAKNDPNYWMSREARVMANPSHEDNGGFLLDEKIASQIEEIGRGAFERYHLDLWGQKDEAWLKSGEWARGNIETRPLMGRRCYVGLDLSTTTDFTSMALFFPDDSDQSYDVLPFFWVPQDRIPTLAKRLHVPIEDWVRQGLIEATPGDVVDYDYVKEKIKWAVEDFNVQEVCYDPWNATDIVNQLEKQGYTMIKVPQTIQHISAAVKHIHRKILEGKLRHAGHEVLAWNFNCAITRTDNNGNLAIKKPDLGKDAYRIDGAAAVITAASRGMFQDVAEFSPDEVNA